MRTTTIGILAAGIALGAVAYLREGMSAILHGLNIGASTLLSASLLIVAAFLLSGLMQVLITRAFINRWLGGSSGFRGILVGSVAGGIIPGGPYGYYPIIATLIKAGAEVGPLIAFAGGKSAWAFTRLPMELAFLGPQLTLIRLGMMLPIPILMGLIARLLFPDAAAELRQWQREAANSEQEAGDSA